MTKRLTVKCIITLMFTLLLLIPIAQNETVKATGNAVRIYLDEKEYKGKCFLEASTTYVGIRDFAMKLGAESVEWDQPTSTAKVNYNEFEIIAENRTNYIVANDRYIWNKSPVKIVGSTMYIPVRSLAKAFNISVEWEQETRSVHLTKEDGDILCGDEFYNEEDLYWLSHIISAEAGVEPFEGKIAVGTVVLNRCKSPNYPESIYDVIFDTNYGVQFSPTENGTVYDDPNEDSIKAAKICLDGGSISDDILFFLNEKLAKSTWIQDNRTYVTAIGSHTFYS